MDTALCALLKVLLAGQSGNLSATLACRWTQGPAHERKPMLKEYPILLHDLNLC